MSRKHNTQHNRSKSNYPQRLQARGVTSAGVRMTDVETLRKRQTRRTDADETPAAVREAD